MHILLLYFYKKIIDFAIFLYSFLLYCNFSTGLLSLTHLSSIIYIILIIIIVVLTSVIFLTLLRGEKLASTQNRKGSDKAGFLSILWLILGGAKLILKETIFPQNPLLGLFFISPTLSFSFSFIGRTFISLDNFSTLILDLNYGFFLIFIFSIFHVYLTFLTNGY